MVDDWEQAEWSDDSLGHMVGNSSPSWSSFGSSGTASFGTRVGRYQHTALFTNMGTETPAKGKKHGVSILLHVTYNFKLLFSPVTTFLRQVISS